MMKVNTYIVVAAMTCLYGNAMAREYLVEPMPESVYADSEVSTNVPFNSARTDLRDLEVRLTFVRSGNTSACIAFGCDSNGNGDLEPEETEFVVGRRQRRCYIEDVASGRRYVADDVCGTSYGYLKLSLATDMRFVPRTMELESEAGPLSVTPGVQPWMFKRSWNLMKITGRGTSSAYEVAKVDCTYRRMMLLLR